MDYAAHAAAAAPAPAANPHPAYANPYGYPYNYPTYHQPDPATADPYAASSSYYYPNPTVPADAQAQYNPCANTYHYYDPSAVPYGGGGQAEYYYSAGQASQAPAVSAAQAAPAAAGREAGKHFGFDPRRYAQVAAVKAPNGMVPEADATAMHHAQWNAHFGHPLPRNAPRKFIKKAPKVVQPLICEVCKVECDTQEVLVIHKTGKKHKKNMQKLQDSITPKPVKPPNGAVGASAAPAVAVANGVIPGAVGASAAPAAAVANGVIPGAVGASAAPAAAVANGVIPGAVGASAAPTAAVANGVIPGAVGVSAAPVAAVANGVIPAIRPKKKKSSAATPEHLEVKKRRVLEAGAAEREVKICTACNVVVNSLKVYEFHISGHKHKANVRKQEQAQQLPHVA